MGKFWLLVLLFCSYLIHELWVLMPDSKTLISPFLLSDQQVTIQYYVFGASEYLILVILTFIIHTLFIEARDVTKWFLIFQIVEFFEYFLTYNEPVLHLPTPGQGIGINITNIKVVVMFILIVKKYITWNPGK